MTGIYKHVETNGKTSYSDQLPSTAGQLEVMTPGVPRAAKKSDEEARREHQEAVQYIKEAQKRIPKLHDYWRYIEFLRSRRPADHRQMLIALKIEDPQAYYKLQQYPAFRPLRDTALGWKAADKHIAAGIGLATGKFTGSVEKWLETTVQDMMKAQRWGPYADVLRSETKPLNAKPQTYSNSRFGQYLKVEDARLEKTAAASAKAMDSSRVAVRTGVVTSINRTGNVLIELGFGALKVETFSGISAIRATQLGKQLVGKGILTQEEAMELRGMMARGEFDKALDLIDAGAQRAAGKQ